MKNISWTIKNFEKLTLIELYEILKIRSEVFIVEQKCIFQDIDDHDKSAIHLIAWQNDILVGYTRLLPPGIVYPEASIGRVISSPRMRKIGIGKMLMQRSIKTVYDTYKCESIKLNAQLYLKEFYKSFGFIETSEPYLYDNILHIEMLHKHKSSSELF